MTTYERLLELLNDGDLKKLQDALKENIREEVEQGKGTKKKDDTIIKSIIKYDNKNNPRISGYHNFNLNEDEMFGFTDGYRILASKNNFGYNKAENSLNISKMITSELQDGIEIEVDINDLKTFCKVHKKDYKDNPYILEYEDNKRIGFNPFYLLDALDFCECNVIKVIKEIAPAWTENKDKTKISILLPIKL